MRKFGAAVIPMKQEENEIKMEYLLGNEELLCAMPGLPVKEPFALEILEFCAAVSKELMMSPEGKSYSDIITLGFWLRRGAIEALRKRYLIEDGNLHLGRGMVFHVTPSNVPVNFAYSLFTGLLCGNANVVRVPSKDFPQVQIIIKSMKKVLPNYSSMVPYICLVRYGHDQKINERLSSLCDVRIIWGGDATIAEIRRSPLQPRATEITFADRFSLAVIDAAAYRILSEQEKRKIARGFYNDTYLTDQNACTSPRIVIWLSAAGESKEDVAEIRKEFWGRVWEIVEKEYVFQDIQGVNKLTKTYLLAADKEINVWESRLSLGTDNRLICVEIDKVTDKVADYFDNAGYFLEYVTNDMMDIRALCDDKHCQTIGYIGEKEMFIPLIETGLKGVDRVVPIGKTMDFDLLWDGYNLVERLSRTIAL